VLAATGDERKADDAWTERAADYTREGKPIDYPDGKPSES
jgi:hypothetical protein